MSLFQRQSVRYVRFGSLADKRPVRVMSALSPIADIRQRRWDVR